MANDTKNKRDPFENAPSSQDIMSGARRRNTGKSKKRQSQSNDQEKTKITVYVPETTHQKLKRYAFETDDSQSHVVEMAVDEYIKNHPYDEKQ